jgi:pyruvate/2-oxoglutarate dehydrogenase complex dihydrolipoamide dehydrogenase (E3) component
MDYDLIVIGGGAGGLSAARAGAQRGLSTLLISAGPLGGDCTFSGCIPSKTLIEGARQGLSFAAAMDRMRRVVASIADSENADVLRSEGVRVLEGIARFVGPRRLAVGSDRFAAKRFVVATGSTPTIPSGLGLDSVPYLTNETVFDLKAAPESLAILGGGPLGCELAQAYQRLGVSVTVFEAKSRLLPDEEAEVGSTLADVLRHEGVDVQLAAPVSGVTALKSGLVEVRFDERTTVVAERLLVAGGRSPVAGGLDAEAGGVTFDRQGFIITDDFLATTAQGVFAVGDVTGRQPYTHAADEMGRIAVANAFSRAHSRRFRTSAIPWVTFTDPEIARVGMNEEAAAAVGGRVAYVPMTEVDRAITCDHTVGFVKLMAGPRRIGGNVGGGKLLGATIMSERGGELIHEVAMAMRSGMLTGRLAQTVHAYPTWSIAIRQAAGQFFATTGGRDARPARREGRPDDPVNLD